jgi:hypothetical protein
MSLHVYFAFLLSYFDTTVQYVINFHYIHYYNEQVLIALIRIKDRVDVVYQP